MTGLWALGTAVVVAAVGGAPRLRSGRVTDTVGVPRRDQLLAALRPRLSP